MTKAVCFSCGEMKAGALVPCPYCGIYPKLDNDLILSLSLTSRQLGGDKMAAVCQDIKQGRRLKLDEETRQRFQACLEEFKKFPIVKR